MSITHEPDHKPAPSLLGSGSSKQQQQQQRPPIAYPRRPSIITTTSPRSPRTVSCTGSGSGSLKRSPRGPAHPSASSRFRGLRGSLKTKRPPSYFSTTSSTISSKPMPPSRTATTISTSSTTTTATPTTRPSAPSSVPQRARARDGQITRASSGEKKKRRKKPPGLVETNELNAAYYAHKKPPWSDVGYNTGARPVVQGLGTSSTQQKQNNHMTTFMPNPVAAGVVTRGAEDGDRDERRPVSKGHGHDREAADHTSESFQQTFRTAAVRSTSGISAPAPVEKTDDTMSMDTGSIMIGLDSAFSVTPPSHLYNPNASSTPPPPHRPWTPATPEDTLISAYYAPSPRPTIDHPVSEDVVHYFDVLEDIMYEDLLLLPSSVYRRESIPPKQQATEANIQPAAVIPPSINSLHPSILTPGFQRKPGSFSSEAASDLSGSSIWDDEVPGSPDDGEMSPTLTPATIPDTTSASDAAKSARTVETSSGLWCPGCRIGGRTPRESNRDTPRDGHRGTLLYPEERDSGFCNACRHEDLVPDISRFTSSPEKERDEDREAEEVPPPRIVSNEIEVREDKAGPIVPSHSLDNGMFKLGATKESGLASRRLLETDGDSGKTALRSVTPEQKRKIGDDGHIAKHDFGYMPDSPSSEYEPATSSDTEVLQQLGSLPSHFSLSGSSRSPTTTKPLRLATQVAERNLYRSNAQSRPNRPSRHISGSTILSDAISNASSDVLDDYWEADILKDYGAMTPIDTSSKNMSSKSFTVASAAAESPRMRLTEEALKQLEKSSVVDLTSAKSADTETQTPRTYMYNRHKRDNGDF